MVYLIHVFTYFLNFKIFITNDTLGPVLICDDETGTKGAIASIKENSQFGEGDTLLSSYSIAHHMLSPRPVEGAAMSSEEEEEEHLTWCGGEDVGKVLT